MFAVVPPWEWDFRDLKPAREEASGGGGRRRQYCVPGARSFGAWGWVLGKGRMHRKTHTSRAKEGGESVLWEAGTALPGGCVSVAIRKLWRAQEGCLIC